MNKEQIYSNYNFDRGAELRETNSVSPTALFIPVYKEKFFLGKNNAVLMKDTSILTTFSVPSEKKYFLGILKNKEVWCFDISEIELTKITDFLGNYNLKTVRECFPFINKEEASLIAYAKGIIHWNTTHLFCSNCGSKTIIEEKGHSKKCTNNTCGFLHFPRINPAIITLIEYKQDELTNLCLLNMHESEFGYTCSLFSGFSEIGESLEDTVKREMNEEVGLIVDNIKYITSQPWSNSASLMLGFSATSKSKKISIDNKEIKKAQWFSAQELNQMIADGKLVISHQDSISYYMIQLWIAQNS